MPFAEIAQDYVQALDARRRRKGDDRARMNCWLSTFRDQDAATISPRQIEKVLTDLQNRGKRPATLIRHLAVLKATFNRAIRLGLLSNNPTRRVKTQKPNNMLVRYLTDEQEAILLNHMPPHYHGIVLTALNTGLRQGELLRLTWADIDWTLECSRSTKRRQVNADEFR